MSDGVKALYEKFETLSGADQLRVAAGLLDKGDGVTAAAIVEKVHLELSAMKLLGWMKKT